MATTGFSYSYLSKLSINKLIIDESFLPMPQYSTTSGVLPNPASIVELLINSEQTKIIIESGNELVTYNRSYLKVLDVLSFIGGIVNIVLIIGIFITGFNRYYFEMCFARRYFH